MNEFHITMRGRILYIITILLLSHYGAIGQLSLETFGKNRVQYKTFKWKYYESGRFRVYYYDRGGAELAKFVAEQADQDVKAMERSMNSNFPSMLNIILYNSYDDYQQTNIGLDIELEVSDRYAGNVNVAGDKLVIYYSGKHTDLKRQLRRGMAQVIMERALFGDDIKSFAKNAIAQKIPRWNSEGYIDYVVFGWDTESEEEWKQYLSKDKVYFEDIAEVNPNLAGRAFWKYINDRHGANEVRNLYFYILQKNNLNSALKQKYGLKQKQVNDSVIAFFRNRYQFEEQLSEDPVTDSALFTIVPDNEDVVIREIKVSPRGSDIAYVEWEHGEYRVVMEKTENQSGTNKKVKGIILRGGVKDHTADPDEDYPLLAWSNTGFKLAIVHKKKNLLRIRVYDAVKGEMKNFYVRTSRFDRIQGFTFMEDDEMIIMSGIANGQSDLYEYRLRTGRFTPLTDDTYDDLSPVFITGGARKGIAFLSNRPLPILNIRALPNELPTGPINAYFYNYVTKSTELMQLTKEGSNFVSSVIPYGPDYFAYLSHKSGIMNRYVVLFARDEYNKDTAYSVPVTNYSSNIIGHQYNAASGKIAEVVQENRVFKVFFRPLQMPRPIGNMEPKDPLHIKAIDNEMTLKSYADLKGKDTLIGIKDFKVQEGDAFLTDFDYAPSAPEVQDSAKDAPIVLKSESVDFAEKMQISPADSNLYDSTRQYVMKEEGTADGKRILYVDSSYIKLRSNTYRNAFHTASFSIHLDNSIMFNRYQNYGGNFGTLGNPDLGGMATLTMKDRLEDHRITAGLRVNSDFTMSYLMKYENLKKKMDWGITGFMQNNRDNVVVGLVNGGQVIPFDVIAKGRMTILQLNLTYPFNTTQSLRGFFSVREDRTLTKASNLVGLLIPDLREYFSMNRIEYVHDDTEAPALNIFNGMRYKLFAEFMYKFSSENEFYSDRNGNINNTEGGFYNVGFDIRYYKKIYRNLIFAVRGAGAHSGGSQQIMYVLGGVDNWFNARYNDLLLPSLKNNYAFQYLATNLRGYSQNARNGNTYAVINAELRLPLISTFSHQPIQSLFLKNLQLVAFVDAGSAWEGLLPDNQLQRRNTFYYPDRFNPLVTATVPYPSPTGLALGYGLGLRMYVYSYFLRFDFARNIENKNTFHFSLGFDF